MAPNFFSFLCWRERKGKSALRVQPLVVQRIVILRLCILRTGVSCLYMFTFLLSAAFALFSCSNLHAPRLEQRAGSPQHYCASEVPDCAAGCRCQGLEHPAADVEALVRGLENALPNDWARPLIAAVQRGAPIVRDSISPKLCCARVCFVTVHRAPLSEVRLLWALRRRTL